MSEATKLCVLFYVVLFVENGLSCTEAEIPFLSITGHVIRTIGDIKYLDQEGPFEMLCRGQKAESLKVFLESANTAKLLPTEVVNKTTVRLYKKQKEKQMTLYRCWEHDPKCKSSMFIVINSQPDVRNFTCVSENFESINCSWVSNNVVAGFNVFLINRYFCTVFIKEVTTTLRYCSSDYIKFPEYLTEKTLRFAVEACANFNCRNNTFEFDHLSIVKLDPPENLHVLSKTSHGVLLQWQIPLKTLKLLDGVEHRVEYRYPGIQPLEVNTTSVISKSMKYELLVHLPCANQYYKVKVAIRPVQAINEKYWSEFATVSFVTDQNVNKDAVEPTCEKFDVDLTPEIMLYKLDKLRTKIMEIEQPQLKRKIKELKAKAADLYV